VQAGATEGLCFFEWAAADDEDPADPDTWRGLPQARGRE